VRTPATSVLIGLCLLSTSPVRAEAPPAAPEDAAPAAVAASAPAAGSTAAPALLAPEPADADADASGASPASTFFWALHGFVRTGWTHVEQDPSSFLVGQHGGFRLYNARVNLVGGFGDHLAFDLSADTDQVLVGATNQAAVVPALRDANLQLKWQGASLTVGQFKTPFNGEFLLSDGDVPFARRSLLSDGLAADESRRVYRFMGLDRQLGAMLSYTLPIGDAAARFDAAAVNGNGINQGRNDNRSVAWVGRASVGWNGSTVGVGGYLNDRTNARLAAIEDERDLAFDVDALVSLFGVKVFGMFIWERTDYLTTGAAPRTQWGTVASISRDFDLGAVTLEPAYRFALWSPFEQDQLPDAGLTDHTLGLNVYPDGLPMRLQLNYVARLEQPSRAAPNDVFEAVLQANF
jgi:hypothetical protein